MGYGFSFRPGTHDEEVFDYVQRVDDYHLPEKFNPQDVVIDVGMHIGSFSYKVLQRGSHHVYGYEADPANYECAVKILESFGGRVHLNNKAVWRSDRTGDRLLLHRSPLTANTGGGNVVWSEGELEVDTVALDDIIREVTGMGTGRVRLLKIDCEGAEFPILLTSQLLSLIDEIAGEFHEFGGEFDPYPIPERARVSGYDRFTISELTDALHEAGFSVTSERVPGDNTGLFHAHRGASRVPRPAFLKAQGRLKTTWQRLRKSWSPS